MTAQRIAFVLLSLAVSASFSVAQTPPRLTLKDAEQRALAGHPDIAGARAAAQALQQTVREVKSAYWPGVFGNVTGAAASPEGARLTAGALNNPSIFDRLATGVIASQLVTDFGRTNDLVQSQKLRAGAQEQDVALVQANLRISIRRWRKLPRRCCRRTDRRVALDSRVLPMTS